MSCDPSCMQEFKRVYYIVYRIMFPYDSFNYIYNMHFGLSTITIIIG